MVHVPADKVSVTPTSLSAVKVMPAATQASVVTQDTVVRTGAMVKSSAFLLRALADPAAVPLAARPELKAWLSRIFRAVALDVALVGVRIRRSPPVLANRVAASVAVAIAVVAAEA